MLDLEDRLVLRREALCEEIDGETIIVLPSSARFVVLNATAARLLPRLIAPTPVSLLAEELAVRYALPPDRARSDVMHWAHDMLQAGAVVCL